MAAEPASVPTLTAYRLVPGVEAPTQAPLRRTWMENAGRHVSRCLPLVIANQSGWILRSPCRVAATWDGGWKTASVTVEHDGGEELPGPPAHSQFGHGILTWTIPFLFRTSPGHNLLVRGPSNQPKDGVSPLEGIVETDWTTATFTMNWAITRPGHPVVFEAGEPFCMVLPQRRGELESTETRVIDLAGEPGLASEHERWRESRSRFIEDMQQPGTAAAAAQWQGDYMRGVDGEGRRFPEHEVQRRLPRFAEEG